MNYYKTAVEIKWYMKLRLRVLFFNRWHIEPTTVNAYYDPSSNKIGKSLEYLYFLLEFS